MTQLVDDAARVRESIGLRQVAEGHLRARRWREAAEALAAVPNRDVACELQLNLARNLACLQELRPETYEILMNARGGGRYEVGAALDGRPTVFYVTGSGRMSMSADNDPRAGLGAVFARFKDVMEKGLPVALHGIGDGYLLNALAINAPKLQFGRQQAVYLIEPDAQAIMACMMIHDYSGENGPMKSERFRWLVGPNWIGQARGIFLGDLFNLFPSHTVSQSVNGADITPGMQKLSEELAQRYLKLKDDVDAHYAQMSDAERAALFSENPPRRPRVLVLTTRFSSVLQYSAKDSAEAFEQLGWDAHVFIEPSDVAVITMPKIREDVATFKPDLVLQLDHLRHELPDTFPPQVPFACWAQDHLVNLASPEAAAKVGKRDFVLTGMPAMYIDRWKYPARQVIEISKLTRIPKRPGRWASDGDDLVYVSSASRRPADVAREVGTYFEGTGAVELVEACCGRMIEVYAAGSSLPTFFEVEKLVSEVESQRGERLRDPELRQKLIDVLFDRLGNVLYRQQALRWIAGVARRWGLKLAVYGSGWEKNIEFGEYARGVVKYGDDLEKLTRASRINFVLEPYYCVSHQRLLDGLVAGGFFLIRHHPTNTLCQELLNFVGAHVEGEVASVQEARERIGEKCHGEFETLLEKCASLWCFGDPIEMVRHMSRAGTLARQEEALPHLHEVSFTDEMSLESRIMEFIGDAPRRREIAEKQRKMVEERLSYVGGMRRIVRRIGQLLAEECRAEVGCETELCHRDA